MFHANLHDLIYNVCDLNVSAYTRGIYYLSEDMCNKNPVKMRLIFWYNPQPRSRLNKES